MPANFQLLTRDSAKGRGLQFPFTHCQKPDNIVPFDQKSLFHQEALVPRFEIHKNTETDIATYGLNWPRGCASENIVLYFFLHTPPLISLVDNACIQCQNSVHKGQQNVAY